MLSSRLKELRSKAGLTQQQLADMIGVERSSIGKYEGRGGVTPSAEVLYKLADIFNVSIDMLLGRTSPQSHGTTFRIGVLGSVPAGVPIEAVEDVIDWEEIPSEWASGGREYFALKVNGDSMYPEYFDGDIVIIKKQPCCQSGDDCVVYVNGYEATLKRVYLKGDGSLTIKPINQNYSPRTFTAREVAETPVIIAGVVAELRRRRS